MTRPPATRAFPFADDDFPDGPTAYLLRAAPDLGGGGLLRDATYDARTVLDDLEADTAKRFEASIPSLFSLVAAVVASTVLALPEILQDTLFCELCDFLPLLARILFVNTPAFETSHEDGGGGKRKGTDATAIVVSLVILCMVFALITSISVFRYLTASVDRAAPEIGRSLKRASSFALEQGLASQKLLSPKASRAAAAAAFDARPEKDADRRDDDDDDRGGDGPLAEPPRPPDANDDCGGFLLPATDDENNLCFRADGPSLFCAPQRGSPRSGAPDAPPPPPPPLPHVSAPDENMDCDILLPDFLFRRFAEDDQGAAPAAAPDDPAAKQRIVDFYRRHNPSKLGDVDALVAKYATMGVGAAALLEAIEKKYAARHALGA